MKGKDFIELFAGIGLVRMGLESAGWNCVYANDIDPKKAEIYKQYFRDDHFVLGDIASIEVASLPIPSFLLTASFPCVDLSLAGNMAGLNGEESGTFWSVVRILKELKEIDAQPPCVLFENVMGFLSADGGRHFFDAAEALNKLGYVIDAFVLDARHFAPQSRSRLFIVGCTEDLAALSMVATTEKTEENILLKPKSLKNFIDSTSSKLRWGALTLPHLPKATLSFDNCVEEMDDLDSRWWSDEKAQDALRKMSPLHRGRIHEFLKSDQPKYGTVYRRKRAAGTMNEIRTDGLAGCLRTPRGGSSRQIVFKADTRGFRIRWMTPREYARLQGVPDSFPIVGTDIQAIYGFGDAVCVPVLSWIGNNVLNSIFKNWQHLKRGSTRSSPRESASELGL